jgi:hypothetical protein
MLKKLVLLSVGIVVLLLLPGAPFGLDTRGSTAVSTNLPTPSSASPPVLVFPTLPSGPANSSGSSAPTAASATVLLANFSKARDVPGSFWGVNVAAAQKFTTTDAKNVAATPATYIRFPGGVLGEEYNYTSGVLTSDNGGGTKTADTSIQGFITSCLSIKCHAILQLPAEIDRPQTAAYYAGYVVNTLHFKPSYWEIGNAVQSWSHFDTPWSQWGTTSKTHINATLFAQELAKYVIAVRAVVPGARIIALGLGMGHPNNDLDYITEVARVDGKNISGVSMHSYTSGSAPAHPTWAQLLANLNGRYSLFSGVTSARGYLASACAKCNLQVFVTEANAAEVNSYSQLLPTFAGTVYVAADTAQALNLRLRNLDWFAYSSNYLGAWERGKVFGQQYTLMTQMMTHLKDKTVATTVTGPSLFYAVATYSSSGLALLMVNANVTQPVNVNLAGTGILSGATMQQEQWKNGSTGPTNSSLTLSGSLWIPALSITILTVSSSGLGGVPAQPAPATTSAPVASCHSALTVATPRAPRATMSAAEVALDLRGPD